VLSDNVSSSSSEELKPESFPSLLPDDSSDVTEFPFDVERIPDINDALVFNPVLGSQSLSLESTSFFKLSFFKSLSAFQIKNPLLKFKLTKNKIIKLKLTNNFSDFTVSWDNLE
jgi:hypothetical protein